MAIYDHVLTTQLYLPIYFPKFIVWFCDHADDHADEQIADIENLHHPCHQPWAHSNNMVHISS